MLGCLGKLQKLNVSLCVSLLNMTKGEGEEEEEYGLTISRIKEVSGKSFESGEKLFEKGSVIRVRGDKNVLKGRVLDDIVYSLTVSFSGDESSSNCICSSSDKICRHAVAVLLYASRNLKKIFQYEESHGNIADYLLEELDDDKSDFMSRNLVYNKKSFERLLTRLEDKYTQTYIDCLDAVGLMFYDVWEKYGTLTTVEVDFREFFEKMKKCQKSKSYSEAAKICQAVSEGIASSMDYIDDSTGYYADVFVTMLKQMAYNVNNAKLNHLQKRQYISYLYDQFIYREPDYFNEFYHEALKTVCITKKDLEYWKMLHEPAIPRQLPKNKFTNHYDHSTLVEMQADILEGLGDPSLEALYEKYYRHSSSIYEMYIKMLKGTNKTKMRNILKEGASLFPWIDKRY